MRIFRVIYAVWFFFNFLWVFVVLLPFFYIAFSKPEWYKYGHKLRALWGKAILILGFVRLKVYNKHLLDRKKTYVIVANHASYFDIISITCGIPVDLNFMSKIQLQKIPLFGIFSKSIDISVDRHNSIQAAKAYMRANQQLKNNIRSICIFPEGGIKEMSPLVSKFKEGAFKMAVENGTTILPVSILDNWKLSPNDKFEGRPGIMRIYIHEPIDTKNKELNEVNKLCNTTYHTIKRKVEENI